MKSLPLQELLVLVGHDNADAFRELFSRYKEKIFRQVHQRVPDKDEAKDIAQEVFLFLWVNRSTHPILKDFDSYLYVIVRNKVISFFRKNTSRIAGEKFLLDGIQQLERSSEELTMANELSHHIDMAVGSLPATMKKCFQLSRNEGKKNGEIARELNLSEQTVRNNISEALKRIRGSLEQKYAELLFLAFLTAFIYFTKN